MDPFKTIRVNNDPCLRKQAIIVNKRGLRHKKICLRGFANNKAIDQPAHTYSTVCLISAFVIGLLENIIKTCFKGNFIILASLCS